MRATVQHTLSETLMSTNLCVSAIGIHWPVKMGVCTYSEPHDGRWVSPKEKQYSILRWLSDTLLGYCNGS